MITMVFLSFISIVCLIQPIVPFYIPGVAPLDFHKGENVEVKVIYFSLKKKTIINNRNLSVNRPLK